MLFSIWNDLLLNPLLWLLVSLTRLFFNNLGLGILALTFLIRLLLVPLTNPSLRAAQKQQGLSGKLNELKKIHKDDKKKLAEAQMELFRREGINPAAGCLPQVIQIIVLIALYQVFNKILGFNGQTSSLPTEYAFINTHFLYLDLLKRDPWVLLPGLAGAAQFMATKMMMPVVKKEEKLAAQTEDRKDDVMYNMQKQMLYLGPVFTVFISFSLPSGLVLYWLATTLFSVFQQGAVLKVPEAKV